MNTPRSFSNRYIETTRMPHARSALRTLTNLLAACLIVAAPMALPAQDQATDKKTTRKAAKKTAQKTGKKAAPRRQRPADALRQARAKLKDLVPFQAEIVETIVVRGKKFRATGKYMQGAGNKLRLEFELEVGRTKGSLVQVCDGTTLFTQQKIGLIVQATRRNVPKILKEMKQLASAAGPRPRPDQFEADLGLGGLDALLGSLEQSMSFTRRREQTFQDRPFTIIEGTWNATFLETLTDDDQDASDELPEYVPDRVRIYIDTATQFPHRIVYLKRAENRGVLRPMVSLEFRSVQVNAPLADASFTFKPDPGVRVQDITDEFIRQIRQAQAQAGAAPAAAAGSGRGSKTQPTSRPPSR
jgi:outer membrane lipoprotein-sorting protein